MKNDQRPEPGTPEFDEWMGDWIKQRVGKMSSGGPTDFDESGVLSGSDRSINSSDAEAFPDDVEEYRPEERKPRLVHSKKD